MKYKNIYSAIHNFGDSFVSFMNYVDGDYVIDELVNIHKKGHDIEIDWLSGNFDPINMATSRIKKSISYRKDWLAKHLKSENVDINCISELKFVWPASGRKFMKALDDRGKEYKIYVHEFK